MKSSVFTFALLMIATAAVAHAELRYTAQVYDEDSNKQKLLYNYKSESNQVGDEVVVTNQFTYPDGKVATTEEVTFIKDKKVRLYKQHQAQLNAEGTIEIGNGKAKFTWTKDGKTKTDEEDAGADFIVGSQIPLHIEDNWDKLMKGEKFKRRLAVLERLETVGFEFSKEKDAEIDGKKAVVIKMKPSSFIIAAIVSPIHFYMSPDGGTLLEIHGRTTVKRDVNGKFKDLDATVVYQKAGVTQAPTTTPAPASGGNSK